MNNQCTPTREAEVSNQIGQLERITEEIVGSISDLRARFVPVLKSVPSGKVETGKEPDSLVPLASTIRQCRNKLSGCNQDIREIIETCEL